VDAIVERVLKGQCQNVHRVGLLYERIASFFREGPIIQGPDMPPYTDPHPYIANADIQADHLRYQATPDAWGLGNKQILVKTAQDRKSAVDAVNFISVQGEGSNIEADLEKSHFGRFLRIYREFPKNTEWRPSRNIATNPTTTPQVQDRSRQIEGEALPWAGLLNLRYRMLLMYLKHSFYIEAKSEKFPKSPRGALVSWAFGEMYNVRSLSEILMTLPLKPESPVLAGPPFEMPYSMAMPGQSVDRWRAHRDLLYSPQITSFWAGQLRQRDTHGGYQVDRGKFDALLLEAARRAGVDILRPDQVVCVAFDQHWSIRLESGVIIHSQFIAEASGRSWVLPGSRFPIGSRSLAIYSNWFDVEPLDGNTLIEAGASQWYWGGAAAERVIQRHGFC
jgi:hypothetical protein